MATRDVFPPSSFTRTQTPLRRVPASRTPRAPVQPPGQRVNSRGAR